jgi:hypothetical protein
MLRRDMLQRAAVQEIVKKINTVVYDDVWDLHE